MAYAAAISPRDRGVKDGRYISLKMNTEKIVKGSLVCFDTDGYATATPAASMKFAGVATQTVDNSAGTDGGKEIVVDTEGVYNFKSENLAQTNCGDSVYWDDSADSDSQTVNVADQGVGPLVGAITKIISATECEVRINGFAYVNNGQAN